MNSNPAYKIKKGQVLNPKGKPIGTKNQRTIEWEKLVNSLANKHTTRFNKILDTLPDEQFIRYYMDILKYWRPQLASTTNTNNNVQNEVLTLTINAIDIPTMPSNLDDQSETEDVDLIE